MIKQDRWLFLAKFAEQILAINNTPELIQALSQEILSQVEADVLLNYLVENNRNVLVLNAFAGISEESARRLQRLPYQPHATPTLSLYGQECSTAGNCLCNGILSYLIRNQGAKCFACCPLIAHGRIIGSLAFGSHTLDRFTQDDLELMRSIAAQVSMAIYRMQNEQNLREAEERWRSLSEATFEGILIGENGIVIDLNQQLADLLGWSVDELKGQEILKFIAPEDRNKVQESFHSMQDRLSEYQVIRKDGSRRILEAHGYPTMVQGKLRRVTAIRDITERKQLEADLLQRGKQLEELTARLEQRVRDRTREIERLAAQLRALSVKLIQVEQNERQHLASILHDDIQQLLVASKMRVEMCLQNPGYENNLSLIQEVSQILQEALEHCRSLVVELCPPVLKQVGLVAALKWLATQYEQKHRFKVRIQADPQAEPPTPELASLLFESARELLLNAVKYAQSPEGQVTLSRTPQQEICLCVEDWGKGFDPGAQLDQTTYGFGLFSIQQRLTYIGGKMEIDSALGQGTRVTLWVPIEAGIRPPAY